MKWELKLITYKQYTYLSDRYISKKIAEFLKEDRSDYDVTTQSTIVKPNHIKARIYAAENLIFVGKEIIPHCFGNNCLTIINYKNGEYLKKGDIIGEIKGLSTDILPKERVMLNLIQRLCGIATLSNKYAKIAKPFDVKILDTRKTTPGLRLFEKYAVALGGSYNHRLDLSNGILIKDNHIVAAGSITNAIIAIKKMNLNLPIEIEIDNLEQLKEALEIGVDGILLDNMTPENILLAVSIIRNSVNRNNIFIEASGNITSKNIISYLNTGINAISIGALTHQAISKNISLDFI